MTLFFFDDPIEGLVILLLNLGPSLLPLLPGLAAVLWARHRLRLARGLASSTPPYPIDAATLAATILQSRGRIVITSGGPLQTYYDPNRREVRLSSAVSSGHSPLALAFAARESGYALASMDYPMASRLLASIVLGARLACGVACLTLLAGLLMLNVLLCYRASVLYSAAVLPLLAVRLLDRSINRRSTAALVAAGLESITDDPAFLQALDATTWDAIANMPPRIRWVEEAEVVGSPPRLATESA